MTLPRSETAMGLMDRAQLALEAGCAVQALALLEQAQVICADLPGTHLLRARILMAQGQAEAALAALNAHTLWHPEEHHRPGVLFLRAQALLAAGHLDQAGEVLEELVRDYPDDARGHRMMILHQLKQGRFDAARRHLGHLARLQPRGGLARRLEAELQQGQDPQAAAEMCLTGEHGEWTSSVRLRAARCLRSAGRLREALEIYQSLLTAEGEDPQLLLEAGETADELGDLAAARHYLRRAARYDAAGDLKSAASMAKTLMQGGRFAAAGRAWFKAWKQRPECLETLAGLALCAQLARHERLAQKFEDLLAMQVDPGQLRRLMAQAWLLAQAGLEIGRAQIQPAGSETPAENNITTAEMQELPLTRIGPCGPATSPWREDSQVAPAQRAARRVLSAPTLLDQMLEAAAEVLSEHAEAWPRRADAHYHLGVMRAALGRMTGAQQSVKRALALNPHYVAAQKLAHRLIVQQRSSQGAQPAPLKLAA